MKRKKAGPPGAAGKKRGGPAPAHGPAGPANSDAPRSPADHRSTAESDSPDENTPHKPGERLNDYTG